MGCDNGIVEVGARTPTSSKRQNIWRCHSVSQLLHNHISCKSRCYADDIITSEVINILPACLHEYTYGRAPSAYAPHTHPTPSLCPQLRPTPQSQHLRQRRPHLFPNLSRQHRQYCDTRPRNHPLTSRRRSARHNSIANTSRC
jgi:hypothetical protein